MKKVLWIASISVLFFLLYYLLIKPFEFEANLKARTLPGDLIETIRIWNRSLDSANIVEVDSFSRLKQTIVRGDRNYVYNWNFTVNENSYTKVNIKIAQPGRGFWNKILIPFTKQPIEADTEEIVREFYAIQKSHMEVTRVNMIGEVTLDSSFCVCKSIKTNQIEKANGMMKDYSILTEFIVHFKLEVEGPPLVKVVAWNHSEGSLTFDFCFPILRSDSLPVAESIFYQRIPQKRALKAEYYGNYITSDRAWYELIHYAEKNGYEINGFPIEYFYNNPNLGMNEIEWRADVYLPIK